MRLFAVKTVFCCWPFYNFAKAAARTHPSRSGELGGRQLTPIMDSDVHRIEGNESVDVRHGVLFQTNGCPQAITSARAQDIRDESAFTGNTIRLQSQPKGRTGNHFVDLSQLFSMAYCCRSSLLELPETDKTMPSEDGGIWKSAHPWYDFSDAKMDLLPEFGNLSDRADVCHPNRVASGRDSYHLTARNCEQIRNVLVASSSTLIAAWNRLGPVNARRGPGLVNLQGSGLPVSVAIGPAFTERGWLRIGRLVPP